MLNNRTIYTIQALCELARCKDGFITAKEIAKAQNLPQSLVPQILADLARLGFVKSVRGYKGGARSTHPPEKIRLLDIIEAVQGSIFDLNSNLDENNVTHRKLAIELRRVSKTMKSELGRLTLADLIEKSKEK